MEEKVVVKKPPKSPTLAGFLACIPGIGAIYNGQLLKGIIFIIIYAGLISMQEHEAIQPLAAFLLTGFIIYMIIEAVQTAKKINRSALIGEKEEEAEEEVTAAIKTGSVFWGAILMGLGLIFLLANFDVLSYGTVFDFWPLVVIVIGIKLVVDYLSRK